MVSQRPHSSCNRGVVGDDASGVPPGAQVLGRIEAEAAGGAERAGCTPVQGRALRLRRVFDQGDPARRRQVREVHHPRHVAVQLHRDQRGGARGDRRPHDLGGDEQRGRVDVQEARSGARQHDRLCGCDERVGREQHLVPLADSQRAQHELDRVRPVRDRDGMVGAAVSSPQLFELRHRVAADEARGRDDPVPGVPNVLLHLGIHGDQVRERDRGGTWYPRSCSRCQLRNLLFGREPVPVGQIHRPP